MPRARKQPEARMRVTFPDDVVLRASAERINSEQASKYRRLNQAWQMQAFGYYRTLGECWYPAQFYAHALPLIRFYAGTRDAQGQVKELPETDWASEQLNRIQDPGGGRSNLLGAYGRLNFLTGDAYLVGSIDGEEEGWECLSSSELRAIPGTNQFARVDYPGATPEELDALPDDDYEPLARGIVVYRIWTRDPEYSMLADSPVRAVLPLYEQLTLLELAVTARAKSRIANAKVLLVADELSFGAADSANDEDPQVDPFMQRLTQVFINPIKNPGSASAVAPPILRVPAELIKDKAAMQLIEVSNPMETYPEREIRDEIRNRIALGLDMPAEIMLGLADSNHWNAFQIDEASWNAHLKPTVIRLCDDLGRAFLRPLARKEGKEYSDGELVVWFDESEVVNHPNRTEDVREAWRDGVAGSAKYLEVIGLDPSVDGPTEEDRQTWMYRYGRGQAQVNVEQGEEQPADGKNPGKPPEPSTEQLQDEDSAVTASSFAERAVGAAELAVVRCRALAGSRLRTKLKQACPDVPNALVASSVGAEGLTGEPQALVAGGADEMVEWLQAEGAPVQVARRIGQLVERHAAATLCSPAPLAETTQAFVRKALGMQQAA